MPRQPRLALPGRWYHVMFRGVGGVDIFRDDDDRNDLLDRFDRVWADSDAKATAWSLMGSHGHWKVGTGQTRLGTLMQRVLGGYAARFNKRHGRFGHLFQDRFLSVPILDDQHFRHLDAYILGNPLAAAVVPDVDALSRYEWSGLGALLGVRPPRAFHDVALALSHLGPNAPVDRALLISRVGAVRSALPDVQHLGASAALLDLAVNASAQPARTLRRVLAAAEHEQLVQTLLGAATAAIGIDADAVSRGVRSVEIARIRALVAHAAVDRCGVPGSRVAVALGVSPQAVSSQCGRGRRSWESEGVVAGALEAIVVGATRNRVESGEPSPGSTSAGKRFFERLAG